MKIWSYCDYEWGHAEQEQAKKIAGVVSATVKSAVTSPSPSSPTSLSRVLTRLPSCSPSSLRLKRIWRSLFHCVVNSDVCIKAVSHGDDPPCSYLLLVGKNLEQVCPSQEQYGSLARQHSEQSVPYSSHLWSPSWATPSSLDTYSCCCGGERLSLDLHYIDSTNHLLQSGTNLFCSFLFLCDRK